VRFKGKKDAPGKFGRDDEKKHGKAPSASRNTKIPSKKKVNREDQCKFSPKKRVKIENLVRKKQIPEADVDQGEEDPAR